MFLFNIALLVSGSFQRIVTALVQWIVAGIPNGASVAFSKCVVVISGV